MPFFINADLEITSKEDLSCITDAFGDAVIGMGEGFQDDGCYFASFEINTGILDYEAEQLIDLFCDQVSLLSPETKIIWDSALRRVIDLGYQSDDGGGVTCSSISAQTMNRMSDLGIEIAITVYPLEGKLDNN